MNFWIGLVLFSIVSAFAASLYSTDFTFIGGAINGLCYSAVYRLGRYDQKHNPEKY